MARCRQCRKEISDEAVYCVHCGLSTRIMPTGADDVVVSNRVLRIGEERVLSTGGPIPIDELPPEVRALLQNVEGQSETVITYRDASGQEQTYRSIDDLPPEVREKFKQAFEAAKQSGETLRVETRRTYDLPVQRAVYIQRTGCATRLLALAGLLALAWVVQSGSG